VVEHFGQGEDGEDGQQGCHGGGPPGGDLRPSWPDLEKRGLGVYAEITVKRSLAKRRRWQLVANRRRAPRGYYLPENLPLFRHLCRG
jgi:hypothetical protein